MGADSGVSALGWSPGCRALRQVSPSLSSSSIKWEITSLAGGGAEDSISLCWKAPSTQGQVHEEVDAISIKSEKFPFANTHFAKDLGR